MLDMAVNLNSAGEFNEGYPALAPSVNAASECVIADASTLLGPEGRAC